MEDCDMVQKEKRRPGEALKDNGGERDKWVSVKQLNSCFAASQK